MSAAVRRGATGRFLANPTRTPDGPQIPQARSERLRIEVEDAGDIGLGNAIACHRLDLAPARRHYRSELDKGHIKATTKVAENLYRKATGEGREAVTAAIFWLKTRAGWKETLVQETRAEIRYVVRMPEPVANMDDWLRRYSSRPIEHEPAAPVGGPFPRLVTESPA